jgi:hypothetical protein
LLLTVKYEVKGKIEEGTAKKKWSQDLMIWGIF